MLIKRKLQNFIFNTFIVEKYNKILVFFLKRMMIFYFFPTIMFLFLAISSDKGMSAKWIIYISICHFLVSVFLTALFYRDLINIRNAVANYANGSPINKISISPLNDCAVIHDGIEYVVEQFDKKDDFLQLTRVENETIFNLISDPLIIIDSDMEIACINKGARLLIGNTTNLKTSPIFKKSTFLSELQKYVEHKRTEHLYKNRSYNDCKYFECELLINKITRFFKIGLAAFDVSREYELKFVIIMTNITDYKNFELSMKDFIANASHEIRTPITSMIGFIETIKDNIKDDPNSVDRFLNIVIEQGNKVVDLLNSLLALSKADFEKDKEINSYVSLKKIVSESYMHCDYIARKKNISISVVHNNKLPPLRANYYGLLRVCNNLIVNAINYSATNKKIEIETGICNNPPFTDIAKKEKFIFFSVKDEGIGMDEKYINRIGERFFKINQENKSGSGLGLSIVNSILERHKARIKVESKKNEGSIFTVYFPIENNTIQEEGSSKTNFIEDALIG